MEKIYIAKLGKTVGLDGYLKLHIESDFPEQFKKDAIFTTKSNKTLTIDKYNKDRGIVKFVGYNTIDEAKILINQLLFTTIEATKDSCKLKEKQFFWFDIISCNLIEDDKLLGIVKEIHRYPLGDYLEIETDKELLTKGLPKVFLVPYTDDYILDVDLVNKNIKAKDAYIILENS